jgi:hypothetical protein
MLSYVFPANYKQIHHMAISFISIYAGICESCFLAMTMSRLRNQMMPYYKIYTSVLWITRRAIFVNPITSWGRSMFALECYRLIFRLYTLKISILSRACFAFHRTYHDQILTVITYGNLSMASYRGSRKPCRLRNFCFFGTKEIKVGHNVGSV